MKHTLLLVGLLLFASVCWGQVGIGAGQQAPTSNTYQMSSHPEHASQHSLGTETSLLESGGTHAVQGERPLWEFPVDKVEPPYETPLGDVARYYRAKKEARLKQGGK